MSRLILAMLTGVATLVVACSEQSAGPPPGLRKQVALGAKLYQDRKCGACHTATGGGEPTEAKGGDLSSVFLAMDTLFVKKHLQFSDLTTMPPIEMTPHEIAALTQYIGVLHAKANMDPNLRNPDGVCPVCGAPLDTAKAREFHLTATYKGTEFYFECPDCKVVFNRDPAWHSQSGWLDTRRGVKAFIE